MVPPPSSQTKPCVGHTLPFAVFGLKGQPISPGPGSGGQAPTGTDQAPLMHVACGRQLSARRSVPYSHNCPCEVQGEPSAGWSGGQTAVVCITHVPVWSGMLQ